MLWVWPDNVMESPYIGFLLNGLVAVGGVDHPRYPRPRAYPNWVVPPTAYDHLAQMVDGWNRACINFLSP